uniref:Integrase core domain containing protein n=1 Tax=Solanum tuberosum TaxID=4113 RepID=M1DIF0_SOLTU
MPETRVVVADIKVFPNIYQTFQVYHFGWMDNAPGEYSCHLTKEFYSSYAATLMNFAADTETTKRVKKEIKDEMQTELAVLKNRLDGLENLVQDRFQAADSGENDEFKSQLAEMRSQIAKLAEQPVHVPTPRELPTTKSGKRKQKAGELDEETSIDPVREAKRQENRARRTSRREAREKEALA